MTSIDYNTDNYTVSELLAILNLDDPSADEIIATTNEYIQRFSSSLDNQPKLVNFFQNIQTKLLRYIQQLQTGKDAEYSPNLQQTNDWYKYESLPQNDSVQKDKITDRVQKIDIYDNNHVPMKQQQLGVNNNYNVDVAQDTLNPNLENTTTRFINIDSQFRQASGGSDSTSTDFTLDLSDPLTDVLNLRLYSIQIPYTWYTIDYIYGNTCFWVTNMGNTFRIFIEPGNYSPTDFCSTLNKAFTTLANYQPPYTDSPGYSSPFTYSGSPTPSICTYNANNGKITINLNGWLDPAGNIVKTITQFTDTFDVAIDAYFTFFDITGSKSCYQTGTYPCSTGQGNGHTINSTLGWLMGFRLPIQPLFSGGNTPVAVINLLGTKYFILVIDDYNQNHINNGLITITELSKSLPLPSYFNASQPYFCLSTVPTNLENNTVGNLSNITEAEAVALGVNPESVLNSVQDKLDSGSGNVIQVLPSAPRTLTQAQIYTINEIVKNRNKTATFRTKAPTNSDTFALVPIKYGGLSTGDIYVDFSGSLQDNKRVYFGPVDIDRMRIRLLDDKGNAVDLHGADWCITLISENLYQY
jgi:hypothetical protein